MCMLMPLWFFLGVAPFVWPVPGFIVALVLVARPERFRVPTGAGFLMLSIVWIAFSAVSVDGGGEDALLFGYRFTIFFATAAMYLWVVGSKERDLPIEAISQWLSVLWIGIVGLGSLALIFGG